MNDYPHDKLLTISFRSRNYTCNFIFIKPTRNCSITPIKTACMSNVSDVRVQKLKIIIKIKLLYSVCLCIIVCLLSGFVNFRHHNFCFETRLYIPSTWTLSDSRPTCATLYSKYVIINCFSTCRLSNYFIHYKAL